MHRLVIGCLFLTMPATAQLADVQPGRNFPTAVSEFGAGRSENVDVGDVDNDGDFDVGVANGGDGAPQANRLYMNDGGLQGGTEGTFVEETATRFAGLPLDTSRDIEFVDLEDDGDLDVFIANRGTSVNDGEVSRAYLNRGGAQLGTIAFFDEGTDAFWGNLVSVPLTQEDGVQDGQGPWKDYVCDCDFGDLDDDGDLDLFNSSYGLNVNGVTESRIFLNDGNGTFDELWPWADAAADIKLHTFDIDIADFDDDYDLDVFASSRDSQARVYRNNLAEDGWTTDPFLDVTQTALLDTHAGWVGSINNYEAEYADLDGDGDFDVWAVNYDGFGDVLLRNEGGMTFSKAAWYKGDPSVDENEADALDYDGDGDLDIFLANFSGTNFLIQSGVADGLDEDDGLFHRTGTTASGSLAPWIETPFSGNGSTTLDADCADMDGDGDPDILLSNDANAANKYWVNDLGVPDTHAPTFRQVTEQTGTVSGMDTVIIAQVRDNAAYYVIGTYDADLVYTVDGGAETCVQMSTQGGQQFRGVIPAGIVGTIAYRVEVTDDAGNTGVSATTSYDQLASPAPPWQNLGCGTTGVYGDPHLRLAGDQTPGAPTTFDLRDAAPDALFLLWISFTSTPVGAVGGTLWANPFSVQILTSTDAGGMRWVQTPWPSGIPSGTEAWWQVVVQDASSIHGIVLSNAVKSTTP